VARFIGARPGSDEPTVAAQEIEFELTPAQAARCLVREDRPELYFCRDMKGYGWCFRKGDYLNIGLGREDSHRLTGHVREFVDWLKAGGRIPRDILERFHGHAYLLYPHAPRRLAGDGVLLIGDAAGLAYPQSGEGILPAVESGQMAAETIIAAAGDTRRDALHAYVRRIGERFGPRDAARTEAPPLIQQLKQQLARTLLTSHWFARHIVVERWFLHTHQPPLLHSPVRQH
jgi:flavin-dependent dehydrogenase